MNIGIEAGHKKTEADIGCTATNFVEADYNMNMSRAFAGMLKRINDGLTYTLIRKTDDELLGFKDRGERAREANCDFVFVLHTNSEADKTRHGALGFHWPDSELGEAVSNTVLQAMPHVLRRTTPSFAAFQEDFFGGRPRRTLKPYVDRGIPAMLLEFGYASNETDLEALQDTSTQFGICAALLCGVAAIRQAKELSCWDLSGPNR